MVEIEFLPAHEIQRVALELPEGNERLALMADIARLNALASVKRAGSGHLGSSFSSLDIVSYLYYSEINTAAVGITNPDRDIYFSSKGHDVPGFYAILYGLGILPEDQFLNLRRISGTPGHPAVGTPGIEANSGSLGMGISKGRGMAWAKQYQKHGGRVFVMTGDGEWQEGQNYEALQAAAHQKITNLFVVMDHNKIQSDKPVGEILDLRDLEQKFSAFGWHVARCDGHDYSALAGVFDEFRTVADKPKILIADTIKGRGVSFMEHPAALAANQGLYRWHAGAPDDESYLRAHAELSERIQTRIAENGIGPITLQLAPSLELAQRTFLPAVSNPNAGAKTAGDEVAQINQMGEPLSQAARTGFAPRVSNEYVVEAYGQALVELAPRFPNLVVLDADLSSDCRLRAFEQQFPDRFIENGIAEQDMVSMAGGLARLGLLPVVNSFAAFLAARANEQIYNNACEQSHIIYVLHYGGLIPAGPGASHQSVRDISLLGALPEVVILQPCNAVETRAALEYCVTQLDRTCILRLNIGPSPRVIELPESHVFDQGRGAVLRPGKDAIIFGYGSVMLHEALLAAETLQTSGFQLGVVNMPWLNKVDLEWLEETIASVGALFVIEDHAPFGGLATTLKGTLDKKNWLHDRHLCTFAVEGYPIWGTPTEALAYHKLDGETLAARILRATD